MVLEKIASVLAVIIGIMSIAMGAKVIRGWQPGWKVVRWLPVYNLVMGILSLIPAALLWIGHPDALAAVLITLATHTTVLLLLPTVGRGKFAAQSVRAMRFRVGTWIVILALVWL